MKKKFFFAALVAAVSLTSCSDSDELTNAPSTSQTGEAISPIAFITENGNAITRAGDVTSLSSLKATAITSTGSQYFSNETFTFGNGMFSSATPYYWPVSGTLDFYATNAGNIDYADKAASLSFTNNDGTTDYVCATYKGASKLTTVPLGFKHIMSRLSVKLKPHDVNDGYDYQISSVTVWAYGSGKYTFGNTTGSVGTWSDVKSYKTYSYTTGLPATTGKSNSGKVINLSQAYYVIPAPSGFSDMITIDVEYKVYKNGVLIAEYTGDDCASIDVVENGIAPGKSVCFTLEPSYDASGAKPISFTATVTPWGTATDNEHEI